MPGFKLCPLRFEDSMHSQLPTEEQVYDISHINKVTLQRWAKALSRKGNGRKQLTSLLRTHFSQGERYHTRLTKRSLSAHKASQKYHNLQRAIRLLRSAQSLSILQYEADLSGLRLLIHSACQIAIVDLRGVRDEVHSLAAGTLQAGARTVPRSVDDKTT